MAAGGRLLAHCRAALLEWLLAGARMAGASSPSAIWHLPAPAAAGVARCSVRRACCWCCRESGRLRAASALCCACRRCCIGRRRRRAAISSWRCSMWGRGSRSSCARDRTCSSTTPGPRFGPVAIGELAVLPYLRTTACADRRARDQPRRSRIIAAGCASSLAGMPVGTLLAGPSVQRAMRQQALAARSAVDVGWRRVRGTASAVADATSATTIPPASCGSRTVAAARCSPATSRRARAGRWCGRDLPPSDVVVVPHHGSRTSSTRGVRRALAAGRRVFSAGYRNRWGFPQAGDRASDGAAGARDVRRPPTAGRSK